jgi:sugar phosphate isomerase/epimerase
VFFRRVTTFRLGVNNCFAVKRWPEPERWANLVRDRLGLDIVQHCLDLADVGGTTSQRRKDALHVRQACTDAGIQLHSTFTGLGVYATNMLLDPRPSRRRSAENWYRRAIEYSAAAGATSFGGHWGAYSAADWQDSRRRPSLLKGMREAITRLSATAKASGLTAIVVENLPLVREPSGMDFVRAFAASGDAGHAAVQLCLDVGHMCTPGAVGDEADPYAWLRKLGSLAPMIHLQQSEADSDRHWPFTAETNRVGRVEAGQVLRALEETGADMFTLILEVVPPFLKDDHVVLDELVESVAYWKEAIG